MKQIIKFFITYIFNFPFITRLRIGKRTTIGRGLVVNGRLKQSIIIGNSVQIGRFARIGNCKNGIIIGNHSSIEQFSTIIGDVEIGDNNLIASYVSFIGGNHNTNPELENGYRYSNTNSERREGIKIGNNCWIGEKAIILAGV